MVKNKIETELENIYLFGKCGSGDTQEKKEYISQALTYILELVEKEKCNIRTCPMFIGLFLEGQNMSGQAKEAINKKLIKWYKMSKKRPTSHNGRG